ncbi:hypothetical protein BDW22DRAFT_1299298, partial [Trametopsis cervina]
VADGVSRRGEDAPAAPGEGGDWSVSEDWEGRKGLVNDLLQLSVSDDCLPALSARFQDEPVFREVIAAFELLADGSGADERTKRRAEHKVGQYVIADGKLWQLRGGSPWRARSRVECVTRAEAAALARAEHVNGGHWGRDTIKIALLDRIRSPRLDQTIVD